MFMEELFLQPKLISMCLISGRTAPLLHLGCPRTHPTKMGEQSQPPFFRVLQNAKSAEGGESAVWEISSSSSLSAPEKEKKEKKKKPGRGGEEKGFTIRLSRRKDEGTRKEAKNVGCEKSWREKTTTGIVSLP